MFDDLIEITTAEELALFQRMETTTLCDPSYLFFYKRVMEGLEEYHTENPQSDKRAYQLRYAAMMCVRRMNFMAWSMRTGKTLTSLLYVYGLYTHHIRTMRKGCIHIVVPSILATMSWVKEMNRFPSFRGQYTILREEKDIEQAVTPVFVYTYDLPKRISKKASKPHRISKTLKKFRPCVLILDEVHEIKHSYTQRSKEMLQIRRSSKRVLALSGTPSEGELTDLNTVLSFIYRNNWPYKSPTTFSKAFGSQVNLGLNYTQTKGGSSKSIQRVDLYKLGRYDKLIRCFMHRLSINDEEVIDCITIPATEVKLHAVSPTPYQVKIQEDFIQTYKDKLLRVKDVKDKKRMAEALQLIQPLVRNCNFPDGEEQSPKINKVLEIVANAPGKVIVFCNRVDSAYLITNALRAVYGDKVVRVYAQDDRENPSTLKEEQRIERVNEFQNGSAKAGVFSIALASQAIDLNQASDVIFYCLPWSSTKLIQAISRPVGPGNPHKVVRLHYPYHIGFIDQYQVLLATAKIQNIRMLLDYSGQKDENDFNPAEAISGMLSVT